MQNNLHIIKTFVSVLAYAGLETVKDRTSYVLKQDKIRIVLLRH
jgi:hypothetical protein